MIKPPFFKKDAVFFNFLTFTLSNPPTRSPKPWRRRKLSEPAETERRRAEFRIPNSEIPNP
ncbi:MAG: hypothetical protein EBS97_06340 [Verrucomicrobia bacterium]|nr:hypothetical protein [Verrucomicrobiota bacterium]